LFLISRSATEIPIEDLVEAQKGSSESCDSFPMEKLHHHAMRALFSMYIARDPYFKIPDYAMLYFETTFRYNVESDFVTIKDHDSLMEAIQYGSEHNICDDNNNIILDCYCTIRNTYISDVDKQLNQMIVSSTRVVDKSVQRLKMLMSKLRQNASWYDKESSEGVSRKFMDRIFQYMFHPTTVEDHDHFSLSDRIPKGKNQTKASPSKAKVVSSLVGKISSAAGKLANLFHHMNQTNLDDNYSVSSADSISLSVFEKIHKSSCYSSSSSSSKKSRSSHSSKFSKSVESPEAIQIVFDCEDQRTPAEWNLFFKVSGHDTLQSLSDSSSSNDGGILVDDEDVISLDESSVSCMDFDMLDRESIKNETQDCDDYSNPSHVVLTMDLVPCPSDEERSMDGVMVHADADVSCCVEESSIESWAEL